MRNTALILALAFLVQNSVFATGDVDALRRLYDMSPVSATNPVVARVRECGIEVSAAELHGFVAMEGPLEQAARRLTLPEKRALLERLVDEHLFLWDAFRQKWDQQDGVLNMVKDTENMMLIEALEQKEVFAKVKKPEDYDRLNRGLRDECFEKLKVIVSNEGYEELKAAIRRLKAAGLKETHTNAVSDSATPGRQKAAVSSATLQLPLANSELGTITIGDALHVHAALPPGKQSDLVKPEEVVAIVKEILGDAVLLPEARARGLHETREFRERLWINRNMLTRFYAQDRITDKTFARLKSPDGQKAVHRWYESQIENRYTHKDKNGKEQVVALETEWESIENDYFDVLREQIRAEEAQALRKNGQVEIDEEQLARMVMHLQSSAPKEKPAEKWSGR